MRNLSVCYHQLDELPVPVSDSSSSCVLYSAGLDGPRVVVATQDEAGGATKLLQGGQCVTLPEDLSNARTLLCALATAEGHTLVAFHEGDLLQLDWDQEEVVSVIGSFPAGIECVSLSPDQELLLISTKTSIVFMTFEDFEPLTEVNLASLSEDTFGEEDFVSVGWGKKETQFHGSEGKARAQEKKQSQRSKSPHDDGKFRISWREDGQLFAVSYITSSSDRLIRIFSREGQLQATSEVVQGLEHCLAWKPSGAVIASMQRLPNKYQVCFFEKNGLRHGEFTLPFGVNETLVNELSWNSNSEALLVQGSYLPTENQSEPSSFFIYVYTCSNYKWSLKQSWTFDSNQRVRQAVWDATEPLKFYIFTKDSIIHTIQMSYSLDHSDGLHRAKEDLSIIGVIDGNIVRVTPLRQTLIPPPMCAFQLQIEDKIRALAFSPNCVNDACLITETGQLHIYAQCDDSSVPAEKGSVKVAGAGGNGFSIKSTILYPKKTLTFEAGLCRTLCNFCLMDNNVLLASTSHPNPRLLVFHLGECEPQLFDEHSCEDIVYRITRNSQGNKAAIELINGTILCYENGCVLPWTTLEGAEIKLPTPCANLKIVTLPQEAESFLLALSDRHRFYLNGVEVASGVRSFTLHSEFLLLTTLKHNLRCLPLSQLPSILQSSSSVSQWPAESNRALERGSSLVLAVPDDSKTVLQMPRGNLEVIHPRALVLSTVRRMLDSKEYKVAMDMLRRHRINLNVFVDHNPMAFLSNLSQFVSQIADSQRLCLFISDLEETDTSKSLYESIFSINPPPKMDWNRNKVDDICQKMLEVLEPQADLYLLPILSCYIKSSLTDVAHALQRVESLRKSSPSTASEALGFLLLLVDVNKLFNVALGLYNFDLVVFIAEKSQKDPKEFLPFLNKLKKVEPVEYRKSRIDQHLKRYSKALQHLSGIVGQKKEYEEEALSIIKAQRLYGEALTIFPKGNHLFKDICRAYGEYLFSKRYFEDSALIYESGGFFEDSLISWEKALCWNQCLSTAVALNLSTMEVFQLSKRLVETLEEANRYKEAAEIAEHYLDDPEEAIALLIEGKAWSEAQMKIAKYNRRDMIETHLHAALNLHCDYLLANLGNEKAQFESQVKRLEQVYLLRESEGTHKDGVRGEDDLHNLEDSDLYSDTTSMTGRNPLSSVGSGTGKKSHPGSLKTRVSQRSKSSKNRRKNERKKYSTKEGSTYEDLGLIASLHEIITGAYKMTAEIRPFLLCLVSHESVTRGQAVQRELSELLDLIQHWVPLIWKLNEQPDPESDDHIQFGPMATTADIVQGRMQKQAYRPPVELLDVHLRVPPPPPVNVKSWKMQILMLN